MRADGRILGVFAMSLAAMLAGCNDYEDRTVELTKVLTDDVQQFIDNGYMIGSNIILEPFEESPDGFYFVDSLEMLDSVFCEVYYPPDYTGPELDSLFSDGGSLLVLDYYIAMEEDILDHAFFCSGDTVTVVLTIRRWLDTCPNPGMWECVFPMGIVLQQQAE
jgi:hypothetical protein